MAQEFLFYDLETWSLDPPGAFLVEAALQRTDSNFTPIDSPLRLICKPLPECVPQPDALMVHGKTPQWAQSHGMDEYYLARALYKEFNRPNTCIIGYNNLRYDDECIRYLLYRNLFDPYTHQYANGNSRWDMFELVRLAFALRPETLLWPADEESGEASLRLDDLAKANSIETGQAHDALSDTMTTIALAQKLLKANPRMVDFAFRQSRTTRLGELAAAFLGNVCLHVSPRIPRSQGHISLVYPVCRNPSYPKQLYAVDLNTPVQMLLDESPEQIREFIFTNRNSLPADLTPPRIKRIHLNRAPLLFEPRLLGATRAAELGIDIEACQQRYAQLAAEPLLADKLIEIFGDTSLFATRRDVNYALYDGFFPNADRRQADRLHQQEPASWPDAAPHWQDSRLDSLWLRLRGRLMPDQLSAAELDQWESYKCASLRGNISDDFPGVTTTLARTDELLLQHPEHGGLLELREYLLGL